MLVALVVALLLVLLLAHVPVAFAIGIAAAVGLYAHGGTPMVLGIFETTPYSSLGYSLSAIPLFILMAQLILHSGVAHSLFDATRVLVGRAPGGLGVATTLAGSLFSAICGSSTASAATLAPTAIPEMTKRGYDPKLANGLVAVVGTLAAMIPPSIVLIFYAVLAEESVGQVLVAGFIPGALVTLTIIATTLVMIRRRPELAPSVQAHSWPEKLRAIGATGPIALLFLLVTGSIYFGITTPTEAAALGVLGALALGRARRMLSWQQLRAAVTETITSSVMIFMIIMSAYLFGYFLTATRVTQDLVETISNLAAPPLAIFALIALIYLALGFFMDQMAILALTVPVALPVVEELGFDPIWFGVIIVLLAEIGMVTPPLGLNVFVVSRASDRPTGEIFAGVAPFVMAMLLLVVICTLWPEIVLWAPSTMTGS